MSHGHTFGHLQNRVFGDLSTDPKINMSQEHTDQRLRKMAISWIEKEFNIDVEFDKRRPSPFEVVSPVQLIDN